MGLHDLHRTGELLPYIRACSTNIDLHPAFTFLRVRPTCMTPLGWHILKKRSSARRGSFCQEILCRSTCACYPVPNGAYLASIGYFSWSTEYFPMPSFLGFISNCRVDSWHACIRGLCSSPCYWLHQLYALWIDDNPKFRIYQTRLNTNSNASDWNLLGIEEIQGKFTPYRRTAGWSPLQLPWEQSSWSA